MPEAKCGFDDGPAGSGADGLVAHGPTLFVDIGFDADYEAVNRIGKPTLAETSLWALVDTGALESFIDNDLALKLNLPIVDRSKVAGVAGIKEVDVYLAHIHVPALAFTIYGSFGGVDLIAGGQLHYALIGRTFLRHFTMTYQGKTGNVVISS